ncbi:hypothetical protein Bca52824_056284 [Brassica carinata]|uniref:SDE2/SF3A3 SAP domain-containing protein n=1 Tax=Brassica carinata TaxID=52824 RepID=A0A8X7QV13_BRACI|nr:hypothetical protein Bca52824_056284 [Brassica carinata]
MASPRFEDSNYAKKLFRLSSLFYGARRRMSFFLIRVDNDSRGGIQLSDYRMGALIDTVDNHEGPDGKPIPYWLYKLHGLGQETVSTWVEGLLRDISKRVSPPNGGQNLKKTYSDLQHVGPEKLKEALGALGLKVGGTLQQRAERLFLTKDYNCSSQCFRFCWRSPIHDDSSLYILELANKEICSTSSTNYGGVKKIASVTVSELNAYALNASSSVAYYGQKLKETDIAIGSGEIPVNLTLLLNETTIAAQATLMKA